MQKIMKIFLHLLLLLSALIYPGMMAVLSALGWKDQAEKGHYPAQFHAYSFWMMAGGIFILISLLFYFLGWKHSIFLILSIITSIIGAISCMIILHQFSIYADQHFSGIGEDLRPVSELYQERLMPILLPAVLLVILSVYRLHRHQAEISEENDEAPKILNDE